MEVDLNSPKFSFSRNEEYENNFSEMDEEKEDFSEEHLQSFQSRRILIEDAAEYCPPTSKNSLDSLGITSSNSRDPSYPMLDPCLLECIQKCKFLSSSKENALLDDIGSRLSKNPSEKFVVFSQFPHVLERICKFLTFHSISSVQITGSVSASNRMSAIYDFNNRPEIKVFLLTIGTGSSGLVSSAKDDEFDFDAPPVIEQKKEEVKAEVPSVLKPKGASNLNSKNYANPENYADRFRSAKSISSDQYFGRESNEEDVVSEQIRKEKFSGSKAISSDDYFNRRTSTESPRNSPTVDLSQLGAAVLQQGAKFANSLLSGRR
jgi:hypothetical protein